MVNDVDENTLLIDVKDIHRLRGNNATPRTHIHTCAGGLIVSWLISVNTAALKGTERVDAPLLTLMLPLHTLV